MRALTYLSITIATLGVAQGALAASKPARERGASDIATRERAAKKACLASDPVKGVELLAELYIDTNDLNYIFNQGRCLEQNSRYQEALGRFREYLLKGENQLTADDKAVAQRHIENCELYLPRSEPRPPVAPAPEPAPVAPVVQPQPAQPVAEPVVSIATPQAQPQEPDGRAGSGLRIGGIAVGTLGVAGVVTGILLNLKANSLARDLEKPDNFNRRDDTRRKDYQTFAWFGYGAGAGCLVAGSVLYYLGWRQGHEATSLALVPNLRADSAEILLQGAF